MCVCAGGGGIQWNILELCIRCRGIVKTRPAVFLCKETPRERSAGRPSQAPGDALDRNSVIKSSITNGGWRGAAGVRNTFFWGAWGGGGLAQGNHRDDVDVNQPEVNIPE